MEFNLKKTNVIFQKMLSLQFIQKDYSFNLKYIDIGNSDQALHSIWSLKTSSASKVLIYLKIKFKIKICYGGHF